MVQNRVRLKSMTLHPETLMLGYGGVDLFNAFETGKEEGCDGAALSRTAGMNPPFEAITPVAGRVQDAGFCHIAKATLKQKKDDGPKCSACSVAARCLRGFTYAGKTSSRAARRP